MAQAERAPYLPPVEKPRGLPTRLVYAFSKWLFGKVTTGNKVFSARMPFAFTMYISKMYRLDKKLTLPPILAALIREQVASVNGCTFCMDATRYFTTKQSAGSAERFDALPEYRTSPLFTEVERAALDYATELTRDKHVDPGTFARLAGHYSEREICQIVWLVASGEVGAATSLCPGNLVYDFRGYPHRPTGGRTNVPRWIDWRTKTDLPFLPINPNDPPSSAISTSGHMHVGDHGRSERRTSVASHGEEA